MSFSKAFQNGGISPTVARFQKLLEDGCDLEVLAAQAAGITRRHFGNTMRLFAPLYLSNECVNVCKYCGFSRHNSILRTTLTVGQVEVEARHLAEAGFRNILLVAGEHPQFVSSGYLQEVTRSLRCFIPSISLEVAPMETGDYAPIVQAGADGLVVYQETYHRETYAEMHEAGPKRDFDWRLDCPERAYEAGFRRLGLGALLGLAPWKEEATALAAHVDYLLKHCWKAAVTISFPRLKPSAGEFEPRIHVSDRDLTRMICAFRIVFPQVGLVLSTREPERLRDGLAPLGITMMSAGSHTEPGGYTGAGREDLHRTERGKRIPLAASEGGSATEQFSISDRRGVAEVAGRLRSMGLEPVWKDWDYSLGEVA
jgi:2-iminoacetate synthase